MSKALATINAKNLPAHLKALGQTDDDWESGTVTGFPVLSTKGKRWSVKDGGEVETIMRDDDPDEPASKILLVALKTSHGVSRTYYEEGYVEGSDDPPTCYSNDGITPAQDVEDRQSKKCATCPKAAWGSRITDSGARGKACSEVKRLAVSLFVELDKPMLLRVPPTSLKNWDNYIRDLKKRGVSPTQVITQVRFDPNTTHQVLIFEPKAFVQEDMVDEIQTALDDPKIDAILGSVVDAPPVEEDAIPEAADADLPPRRKKAQKAQKVEEEDDQDDDPPKRPAKRRAKAKPVDDDEDEAPPKKTTRRKAPVEDDEDDDEPPKRPAKRRTKAKPVEDQDDEESDEALAAGTDGDDDPLGLGDLDLDSLDFGDDED